MPSRLFDESAATEKGQLVLDAPQASKRPPLSAAFVSSDSRKVKAKSASTMAMAPRRRKRACVPSSSGRTTRATCSSGAPSESARSAALLQLGGARGELLLPLRMPVLDEALGRLGCRPL